MQKMLRDNLGIIRVLQSKSEIRQLASTQMSLNSIWL